MSPPPVAPNALLLAATKVPLDTDTIPTYVFVPDKVNEPAPNFSKMLVELPEMTPEIVADLPVATSIGVLTPRVTAPETSPFSENVNP